MITYLEIGTKKVFASVVNWPGWSRWGKDESSALQVLLDYGPRYAAVMQPGGLDFQLPHHLDELEVVERLEGTSSTDFGVPEMAATADQQPVDEAELERFLRIFDASWQALAEAARAAEGKELRKGPRGGGRDVDGMIHHVLEAQRGYMNRIAWKSQPSADLGIFTEIQAVREEVGEALANAVHNGLPQQGPRGGKIWLLRYFVRRSVWHILDHVWEIEDRTIG